MNILGAAIKDDVIKGISTLKSQAQANPEVLYYYFEIITIGGPVEFRSEMILDYRYASALDQQKLAQFKEEYLSIRTDVLSIIGENEEDFMWHRERVTYHFNTLAELHKLLEDELRQGSIENKDDILFMLNDMRPHIIKLKDLAE